MSSLESYLRAELSKAREEIDHLREENRQLRASVMGSGTEIPLPDFKDMSTQAGKVIRVLLVNSPRVVRYSHFIELVWDRSRAEDPESIIKVVVCKARKALRGTGIEIKTAWGIGYSMPTASAEKLRAMVAAI